MATLFLIPARSFTILSGDQLSAQLALEFRASKLIFGVHVDGAHTSNPKLDPNAKLLKSMSIKDIGKLVDIRKLGIIDVTGHAG